jgi:RNA-directed DNA polymerase
MLGCLKYNKLVDVPKDMKSNKSIESNKIGWFDIDWQKCQEKLKLMQIGIAVAYKNHDIGQVKVRQANLVKSFAAKAIAVKIVTSNTGKKTPGVDGILWPTPEQKCKAMGALQDLSNYKCEPVRRVWIPKKDGKIRPLGIPTIKDRAVQTLWKLALDPIAELWADQHSYGFRPYRSCQDVQCMLWLLLSKKTRPGWVLEADIKGFFDNIAHSWLMNNIPIEKQVMGQWLKSGHLDDGHFHDTLAGVPQGGSISPTIANITLDKLTDAVKAATAHLHKKSKVTSWSPKVHVIRYADDFVVTAATEHILRVYVMPAIQAFLGERGLSLNMEKTHITSVKEGFNFVGFHFKVYPYEKGPKGYICLIKPAKNNIKKLKLKLKETVKHSKKSSAYELICQLNPILSGWANYYKKVVSKKAFTSIDHYLWKLIWIWCQKKYPTLNKYDLVHKNFKTIGNRHWVFYGEEGGKTIVLFNMADVPIKRHQLIKNKNPYLPEDQEYFMQRGKSEVTDGKVWTMYMLKIMKNTNFKCLVCDQHIHGTDKVEVHHIHPKSKGGSDKLNNLLVLHQECHKQVTYTKCMKLKTRFQQLGIVKG